jgi:predicted alpha/beta-fold hydrolase
LISVITNTSTAIEVPPFKPHILLRGGHLQTLGAAFLRGDRRIKYQAKQHIVELDDGDSVVLHDDCPGDWQSGQPFVLLMHGLAGCHQSAYMVRLADKLSLRGFRVFRLDHRGCGAGAGQKMAQRPYNAGCSSDVRQVLSFASGLCPGSKTAVAGFSLSANILIKMLGEDGANNDPRPQLVCAAALCPPLDLASSADVMSQGFNRFYERHFVKILSDQYYQRQRSFPDGPFLQIEKLPDRLREFDHCYTARASGFASADEYYSTCSGSNFVSLIQLPTLIVNAANDPLIPLSTVDSIELPEGSLVASLITKGGGHLGFVARSSQDPDRWWMDWRVIDWFEKHLNS